MYSMYLCFNYPALANNLYSVPPVIIIMIIIIIVIIMIMIIINDDRGCKITAAIPFVT